MSKKEFGKRSHLHQDLSAGQHAVFIGERLAQLVEGGCALPEDKQVWPVSTSRISKSGSMSIDEMRKLHLTISQGSFLKPREATFALKCVERTAPADRSPGLLEAVDGVGLQRRQDGPQR